MIPDPYELVLLALASYRTWRLLAEDTLLDRPRRRLLRLGNWQREGDPVPREYRQRLGDFIACPACLGAWLATGWYLAWAFWTRPTLVLASVAALSALVVFFRHKLDPPEE
jgi:hypothetical protein